MVLAHICCQAPEAPSKAKPVAAMVIEPAPSVMEILAPSVKVVATGAAPVEPIKSWPEVKVVAVIGEVPPPMIMPLAAKVVAPVPPLTTDRVEEEVKGDVPPPIMMSPLERVEAPVPPTLTARVVVAVGEEAPLPYTKPVSWVEVIGEVPPPRRKPLTVREVAPVPPLTTERVEEEVTGEVPLPIRMSPAVSEVEPVPPTLTAKVEVPVTAEPDPPPTKICPAETVSKVRESVILTVPLRRVVPKTERVVEGEAVPIPTMPPVNTATGYASLEVPGWVTVKAEAEEEAEI